MGHFWPAGSALKVLLKFCRVKGSNRYIKIFIVVGENNLFGAI